jgi:hypothetical protein
VVASERRRLERDEPGGIPAEGDAHGSTSDGDDHEDGEEGAFGDHTGRCAPGRV